MSQLLSTIPGVILILITMYDLAYTTLTTRGAGPISIKIGEAIWWIYGSLSRLFKAPGLLGYAGTCIVAATLASWVILYWAGNSLIFIGNPYSVVASETMQPADNFERIYYTGYCLSTMGNGDFVAGTDFWRVYSSIVSFSGIIFITIAISYMVPVLDAVTTRRSLSIRIASLGATPQQLLLNSWNGQDFKQLGGLLKGLEEPLAMQGQMHLSYPVLFYYHQTSKEVALMLNLVVLDEALTLLLLYVPEDKRPELQHLLPLRKSITSFIYTVHNRFVKAGRTDAPPLQVDELLRAGVSLDMPDTCKLDNLRYRRRVLEAILKRSGWEWKALSQPVFDTKLDMF